MVKSDVSVRFTLSLVAKVAVGLRGFCIRVFAAAIFCKQAQLSHLLGLTCQHLAIALAIARITDRRYPNLRTNRLLGRWRSDSFEGSHKCHWTILGERVVRSPECARGVWLLHIEAVEMSRRARGEHEAVTRAVDEADGVEVCDGVGYFHRSPDFAGQFLG